MKTFYLLSFAMVISAALQAQPTLTASNTSPVIGEQFIRKSTNYVDPGNSGSNVSWDLSAMVASSTDTINIVAPASTPYASSFPTANLCGDDGSGNYSYSKTSNAFAQIVGLVSSTPVIISYSDPEDYIHYPLAYNDSFTDPWAATFTNGVDFYRSGTTTITADGYGTIVLPTGTFNNILRVHYVQDFQDSSQFGIITYYSDNYFWYLPGKHYVIASVYIFTSSQFGTIQGGTYLDNVITGIDDYTAISNQFTTYPNPASDILNIQLEPELQNPERIEIISANGTYMRSMELQNTFHSSENLKMDVADLPEGVYFIRVFTAGKDVLVKQVLVSR